jgi:hypothetical protein
MSMSTRFGMLVAAALTVGALTVPLSPAKAQAWAGINVGPFGIGVGVPGPYYYPYRPYRPYYPYYYPPRYYYPY